jgi:hypothetical protein
MHLSSGIVSKQIHAQLFQVDKPGEHDFKRNGKTYPAKSTVFPFILCTSFSIHGGPKKWPKCKGRKHSYQILHERSQIPFLLIPWCISQKKLIMKQQQLES